MIRMLLQCEDTYFVNAFSNYASLHCPSIEFVCFTTVEKALEYLSGSFLRMEPSWALRNCWTGSSGPMWHGSWYRTRPCIPTRNPSGSTFISPVRPSFRTSRAPWRFPAMICSTRADGMSMWWRPTLYRAGAANRCSATLWRLRRRGRENRPLYISLDPFPALGQLYEHDFSGTIDDLLFA